MITQNGRKLVGALIAFVTIVFFALSATTTHASLIGHYPLDSVSAGTTPDTTGMNGAGTLNGTPTLTASSKLGAGAIDFDPSSTEFIGIQDAVFGSSAFAINVWMNPDALGNVGPLAQWTNAGASPRTFLFRTSGSTLQTFLKDPATPGTQIGGSVTFPSEVLGVGSWSLLSITYDGQTLRTYLNGELGNQTPAFGAPTSVGQGVQGTAAIGGRASSELVMDGRIDDVSFFDETLTDGKVGALFTVADEVKLGYDASQVSLLFDVFDGNLSDVQIGSVKWFPASGFGGTAGDTLDLGDNTFFVNLDGTAGVFGALLPEPSTFSLAILGLLGFAWRGRRSNPTRNRAVAVLSLTVAGTAALIGFASSEAQGANVALGKPATGTFLDGRFQMAAVTDSITSDTAGHSVGANPVLPGGNNAAAKHLDNYWLAPTSATGASASFTLDLLGVYDITEINLFNTANLAHSGGDSGTNAFQLTASQDGTTFSPLLSGNLSSGNVANVFGGLSASARFLRFQADSFHGGSRAGLSEILVEGTLDATQPHNVAAGKPAIVAFGDAEDSRFPATAATDGLIQDRRRLSDSPVINSYWLDLDGAAGSPGNAIDIDLQGNFLLSEFVLVQTVNHGHSGSDNGDRGTNAFDILVSTDGVIFSPALSGTLTNRIGVNPNNSIPETFLLSTPVQASHVRFVANSNFGSSAGLSELAAIGVLIPEPSTFLLGALGLLSSNFVGWRRQRVHRRGLDRSLFANG